MIFLQLLINGLIAGSIYALVASGFSLIYSTNRFIHFAHGTMVTVGAYLTFLFFVKWGVNFYVSGILVVLAIALLGYVIFTLVYNPLKKKRSSNAILLIASIGLMILLENLMLLIFGSDVKTLNFIKVQKGVEFWGAVITPLQIIIIVSAIILLVLLWLFVKYSKIGKTMRAVADNSELAKISGINIEKIKAVSFLVGSGIAGFAAVLIALEQNIEPIMGTNLMIKGFTGAIIGGVTSMPGAVLGSYLLGIIENFGIWFLPSGYKDAIAFVLLLIFLLIRPNGILGVNKGVRD